REDQRQDGNLGDRVRQRYERFIKPFHGPKDAGHQSGEHTANGTDDETRTLAKQARRRVGHELTIGGHRSPALPDRTRPHEIPWQPGVVTGKLPNGQQQDGNEPPEPLVARRPTLRTPREADGKALRGHLYSSRARRTSSRSKSQI